MTTMSGEIMKTDIEAIMAQTSMKPHVKYLLNKLKDCGNNYLVVKHFLVDKDGHTIWDTVWDIPSKPDCKICCIIGASVFNSSISSFAHYLKTYRCIGGNLHEREEISIRFASDKWRSPIKVSLDDPSLLNSELLESCFMQMMHILSKDEIYLSGQTFFKQGNAYQYLVEADIA